MWLDDAALKYTNLREAIRTFFMRLAKTSGPWREAFPASAWHKTIAGFLVSPRFRFGLAIAF